MMTKFGTCQARVTLRTVAKRSLIGASFVVCVTGCATTIKDGEYVDERGRDQMVVDSSNVRIVRGKSTLYELPNMVGVTVYAKDDFAQSKPQRLNIVGKDKIEWIRESAGPCPMYTTMFIGREPQ